MKTLGLLTAAAAVTTIMVAGPANADITDAVGFADTTDNGGEEGFSEYAIDVNHPGSCLVVQNHTGGRVRMRLDYPTSRGSWLFDHDDIKIVTRDGKAVESPSGRWQVRVNPPITAVWNYDGNRNTSRGCNGSWVLSMN
ncbi:hypothetical protein [Nocardia caishijiensis]|uniref:Uncharacterized protein n=1 Tax=Nocardia caishijiensis TaxID=184756 RepID=A0ABQ6YVP7_9NOCA|nr:hypothetical protein [Nocardia caishijiensis]KAF0849634.1 hypothetical protein FNL39_1011077 [Nocardia caishijiensis]